jgi:catechol 2,3-dioxygenase-like lactoylglutathione lyase family enzyme
MPLHRLDHLLVLTDDLEATRAFYCDALGFEVGDRPPLEFPGLWLCLDGVPCVHVADRAAFEAHAARLGLAVGRAPVHHGAFANVVPGRLRQLYVTDPNGVVVEVNVPAA